MRVNPFKKLITPSLLILALFATSFGLSKIAPHAEAASLANWKPGRIIDDGVFTNSGSMTVANIQAFLNSKVPSCDTNGTQQSEFGGGTRTGRPARLV